MLVGTRRSDGRTPRHAVRSGVADESRSRRRPSSMELVRPGALRLDEPVSTFFGSGAAPIATPSRCAICSSTRPGSRRACSMRRRADAASSSTTSAPSPLEYAPRTQSIYSDLGFILLGFLADDRGGAPLADCSSGWQVRRVVDVAGVGAGRRTSRPFGLAPDIRGRRGADAADGRRTRGAGACSSARCTTTTPPRWAASPATPDCSAPRRQSAPSRAQSCAPLRGEAEPAAAVFAGAGPRVHDQEHGARQLARARLGYDAADLVVRHAACRRRRSATSGSPARRSGSIRSAIAISCCSPTASCGGGTLDEMRTVRRAFHDALGDV